MGHKRETALICGIRGQDGAYLAKLLVGKGYEVWGTSRDHNSGLFQNLAKLNIDKKVHLLSMDPLRSSEIYDAVSRSQADEIYFFSGQSSVGLSFDKPRETIESIAIGTLNILEVCRRIERPVRLYNAGTSECFGDMGEVPANEMTPFSPRSPYAIAKCAAFHLVDNYRKSYNLWGCSGILFNHESPLRPNHYVTQKIIRTVHRIANGSKEILYLGNLNIARDWGWAPEYVEVMWQMLQRPIPEDYVIATGETHTIEEFVEETFDFFGLNWREHVKISTELIRPNELAVSRADPKKVKHELGWQAKYGMKDVIHGMLTGLTVNR